MSRLDETLRPMAANVIARTGTALVLRRAGDPSYDAASGAVTRIATDIALSGVIEEVETGHSDGVVQRGDLIVTLAADNLDADPEPGDDVLIGGAVHRVVSVSATYAGDRPAVFRLHVRR